MPALARLVLAGALGLCLAFLVACGDRNGLIPQSSADRLERQLDAASSALDDRRCAQAGQAALQGQNEAAGLPASVDPRLRRRLVDGFGRLARIAPRDCARETTTTETTTTPTQTETTPTQTETTTTPTETQTTPTIPTTPTTTTPTTPTTPDGTGGEPSPIP
jgi:hypothetical protein